MAYLSKYFQISSHFNMASESSGSSGRDLEIIRVDEPTLARSIEIFEVILREKTFGNDQTAPWTFLCTGGI